MMPTVSAGWVEDAPAWEQKETVTQMLIHGFENVRGWEFTNCVPLSRDELGTIERIVTGTGLCRACGRSGHFATGCGASSKAPWLREIERLRAAHIARVPVLCAMATAAMAYGVAPLAQAEAVQTTHPPSPPLASDEVVHTSPPAILQISALLPLAYGAGGSGRAPAVSLETWTAGAGGQETHELSQWCDEGKRQARMQKSQCTKVRRAPGARYRQGMKKCVACQDWEWPADMCGVDASKFSQRALAQIFEWGRERGRPDPTHVTMCAVCVTQCARCGDEFQLENAMKYGVCLDCNRGFRSVRAVHGV